VTSPLLLRAKGDSRWPRGPVASNGIALDERILPGLGLMKALMGFVKCLFCWFFLKLPWLWAHGVAFIFFGHYFFGKNGFLLTSLFPVVFYCIGCRARCVVVVSVLVRSKKPQSGALRLVVAHWLNLASSHRSLLFGPFRMGRLGTVLHCHCGRLAFLVNC